MWAGVRAADIVWSLRGEIRSPCTCVSEGKVSFENLWEIGCWLDVCEFCAGRWWYGLGVYEILDLCDVCVKSG